MPTIPPLENSIVLMEAYYLTLTSRVGEEAHEQKECGKIARER